jgi:hypothetical protein
MIETVKRCVVLGVLSTMTAISCGGVPKKTPLGPDVDGDKVKKLQRQATSDSGCQAEPMAYSYVGGRIHRMEGCGMRLDYVLQCEGHCGWASLAQLEKRAAFDLACEDLQVQEVAKGTYGVVGCGQRASYMLRHLGWGEFEWMLNSDSRPTTRDPVPED